jgi:hypothetical protein
MALDDHGRSPKTNVCVIACRFAAGQIFWLLDLMLVWLLTLEAGCNYPSENEKLTIKFVIRAYYDFTSRLTGFLINPA